MPDTMELVARLRPGATPQGAVRLEGFHALKHAIRFGADVEGVLSADPDRLLALCEDLAADVTAEVEERLHRVDADVFAQVAPRGLPSPALSVARRPDTDLDGVLASPDTAPVVLLEAPTHLGNVGAVVRVAAAAGAAAVLTTGRADPWHPTAIRGAAGLHFALTVARLDDVSDVVDRAAASARPLVAIDPTGEPLPTSPPPPRAVLAFGTERAGLSAPLRSAAERLTAIPMRPGVSSLNLATAVAVVLYTGG